MKRTIPLRLSAALTVLFLAAPLLALDLHDDIVALVEMPVAVTRVVEVEAVPAVEVGNVVNVLNDLDVSPVDFLNVMRFVPVRDVRTFLIGLPQTGLPRGDLVEIVRYVPVVIDRRVMLIDDNSDSLFDLDDYVHARRQEGLRGTALAAAIHRALRARGVPAGPKTFVVHPVRATYIPQVVRVYMEHDRGRLPPGQAKKLDRDRGVSVTIPRSSNRDRDDVAKPSGKSKAKKGDRGRGNEGKGKS